MSENDHEEPQADVIEQHQQAAPDNDEAEQDQEQTRLPLEADAADAADQARVVELDEEEYR
ncbi:MAG TPA: hypothetical protein VFQ44_25395 [Streptosporangiaceae bacterium]|nr:hypothetical protein [Streptosporangiaceae bacterium]